MPQGKEASDERLDLYRSDQRRLFLLKFYLYKIAFDFKKDRIHTIKYILTTYWRGHGFIHYIDIALVTANIFPGM